MRILFFISIFLTFQGSKLLQASEVYKYFSAPAYEHTFEYLGAKMWVLINRIPELKWKEVRIPPTRNNVSLLPSEVFISGKFAKEGVGKRSLVVNGTGVKVSDTGEFVLRVLIEANEFGLKVALRDLDQKKQTTQTIGLRIFFKKKEENRFWAEKKFVDFSGSTVFTQRKIASLELFPPELTTKVEAPKVEEPSKELDVYLGASLGTYSQQNFERQSPKNTFVRINYERDIREITGIPLLVGIDSRFSVLSLSREKNGTLQFLNPELKFGIHLSKEPQHRIKIFTGTNYFSSFGNSLFGLESAIGQSLQVVTQFKIADDWLLGLSARATWIPNSVTGKGVLSNREFLGGLAVSKGGWGCFSEMGNLQLLARSQLTNSFVRFGFFGSF